MDSLVGSSGMHTDDRVGMGSLGMYIDDRV